MISDGKQLYKIFKPRAEHKPRGPVKLGDAVRQLMEEHISPRHIRFDAVAEIWARLLPAELHQHCKIDDISGGRMKVVVDLPAYMYELCSCSSELLEELQQQCPRAQIKEIKFVVG